MNDITHASDSQWASKAVPIHQKCPSEDSITECHAAGRAVLAKSQNEISLPDTHVAIVTPTSVPATNPATPAAAQTTPESSAESIASVERLVASARATIDDLTQKRKAVDAILQLIPIPPIGSAALTGMASSLKAQEGILSSYKLVLSNIADAPLQAMKSHTSDPPLCKAMGESLRGALTDIHSQIAGYGQELNSIRERCAKICPSPTLKEASSLKE